MKIIQKKDDINMSTQIQAPMRTGLLEFLRKTNINHLK